MLCKQAPEDHPACAPGCTRGCCWASGSCSCRAWPSWGRIGSHCVYLNLLTENGGCARIYPWVLLGLWQLLMPGVAFLG